MGFAEGLRSGVAMSQQWMDTYDKAKRRNYNEYVSTATPYQRYSQADARALEDIANATNEQGLRKYQIEIDPGSTQYRYREVTYPPYSQGEPPATPMTEEQWADWDRRYGNRTASAAPVAFSEAVPSPDVEARGSSVAPPPIYDGRGGYGVSVDMPVNRGVGLGPDMRAAPQAAPDSGDLYVPETNYSSAMLPEQQPYETAAYQGLTRQLGDAQAVSPTKTMYLGKEYDSDKFTPDVQRAAKMESYANFMEQDNPMEAERYRLMATQERRAAESHDTTMRLNKLQLAAAERNDADSAGIIEMSKAIAADPSLLQGDVLALGTKFNVSPKGVNQAVADFAGVEANKLAVMGSLVDSAYRKSGGSLDKFLQSTLDDKQYDPTSHLVRRQGPNGGIIIDTVATLPDGKAGNVISSSTEFRSAEEALDATYNRLRNPGTAAQTLISNRLKEAQIREAEAKASAYESGRGLGRGGAGASTKEYTALLQERRQISAERADILKALNDKTNPLDPKVRTQMEAQHKALGRDLEAIEGLIGQMRPGSAGGGLGPGAQQEFTPGKAYHFGDNVDEKYIYTGDPKNPWKPVPKEGGAGAKSEPKKKEEPAKANPSINQPTSAKPAKSTLTTLSDQFDAETREIDKGTRKNYTPGLLEKIDAEKKRLADERVQQSKAERDKELQREQQRSRALGLSK